jgi:hypothetical protein
MAPLVNVRGFAAESTVFAGSPAITAPETASSATIATWDLDRIMDRSLGLYLYLSVGPSSKPCQTAASSYGMGRGRLKGALIETALYRFSRSSAGVS